MILIVRIMYRTCLLQHAVAYRVQALSILSVVVLLRVVDRNCSFPAFSFPNDVACSVVVLAMHKVCARGPYLQGPSFILLPLSCAPLKALLQ